MIPARDGERWPAKRSFRDFPRGPSPRKNEPSRPVLDDGVGGSGDHRASEQSVGQRGDLTVRGAKRRRALRAQRSSSRVTRATWPQGHAADVVRRAVRGRAFLKSGRAIRRCRVGSRSVPMSDAVRSSGRAAWRAGAYYRARSDRPQRGLASLAMARAPSQPAQIPWSRGDPEVDAEATVIGVCGDSVDVVALHPPGRGHCRPRALVALAHLGRHPQVERRITTPLDLDHSLRIAATTHKILHHQLAANDSSV